MEIEEEVAANICEIGWQRMSFTEGDNRIYGSLIKMRALVLECGEAEETPETLQNTWDNYIIARNVKE